MEKQVTHPLNMSLRPKQDVHIESLRARWRFGPEVGGERLQSHRFESHKNKVDNAIKKGQADI